MATIPLHVAQRRLDAGNVVSYPEGSPIGRAMQGFGDELSAVAEHYRQMKERQEAFDAELARRRFNGQIAQAEDEVAANAPADGAGLHDAMYGQVDPRTGQVVKPGLFDTLFDDALPNMPKSQRAGFARQKEAMRAVGSARMAQRQRAQRDDYEQAQVDTVLQTNAIAIGKADPDDIVTFEAARQDGLDLIDKRGLDPQIRQQVVKEWFSTAAKARFEALIVKDPKRALAIFGLAQAGSPTKGNAAEAVGDRQKPGASRENETASAVTSTSTALSNAGSRAPASAADRTAVVAAAPWIADLPPNDLQDLGQNAQVAMTAQLFDTRTNVQLAHQNAPDALMYTGNYSGKKPDDGDFAAVYGVEGGGKQSLDLERTFKVGHQAFAMVRMPKDAIEAKLLAAKPKPGSATPEQDQAQFDITAAAARQVLQARAATPADFVRKVDPTVDAYWNAVSSEDSYDPAAYQKAIARSVAVQLQLGIKQVQPLPPSVVKNLVDALNDEKVPQRERDAVLRDLFAGTSDPGVLAAMTLQLSDENQSRIARSIANNAVPISAEERVSRNLAAFDALPVGLKALVALNDTVRLMADGATFGYADKFAATMNSVISGSSYEDELAAARAGAQDARDRAGSAGTASEMLGAYLSGSGLGKAGITLTNRFGTATMEGLSGLLARAGLMGVEGAGYGAAEATGRDQPVGSGAASGFFGGAGSNVVAEGLGAVSREATQWLKRRASSSEQIVEPAAVEATSDPAIAEATPTLPAQGAVPTSPAFVGHDLHITYMPHWDAAQRAAADLKVKMLTEAVTVVSQAVRKGRSARKIFKAAGFLIPFGHDIDHVIDLQLGGLHQLSNFAILDSSVNRSTGKQIYDLIKNLPIGTVINKVTIGER